MSDKVMKYICDALVDQKRRVGDDSVGYKCMNEAAWETDAGVLLCDECKAAPERVTLPQAWGTHYQDALFKRAEENKDDNADE